MKSWSAEIEEHVRSWTKRCREYNIKWKQSFAYHFTDVHNAANILTDDAILSRAQALKHDTHLAGIACRTDAERRTLLHLLSKSTQDQWRSKIRCVGDALFFRDRPHVQSVSGVDGKLRIRFNSTPLARGLPVLVQAQSTGQTWTWRGEHRGSSDLAIDFPPEARGRLDVELRIYDCVAYRDHVVLGDAEPF